MWASLWAFYVSLCLLKGETLFPAMFPMEVLTISLNSAQYTTISLSRTYISPVIVSSRPPLPNSQSPIPYVIEIKAVDSSSYLAKVTPMEYIADTELTGYEVTFLVIESGYHHGNGQEDVFIAAGVSRISVDSIQTRQASTTIHFEEIFSSDPIILTQIIGTQKPHVSRVMNVFSDKFDCVAQVEERLRDQMPCEECLTMFWVAVSREGFPGVFDAYANKVSTANIKQIGICSAESFVFMDIQSYAGIDTAYVQIESLTEESIIGRLVEEKSLDDETNHIEERYGYVRVFKRNYRCESYDSLRGMYHMTGEALVNMPGVTVQFAVNFQNPVVVLSQLPNEDLFTATALKLTNYSMKIKLNPFRYLKAQELTNKTLAFVVMEKKTQRIEQSGDIATLAGSDCVWITNRTLINFEYVFVEVPIVLVQIIGTDLPYIPRVHEVNESSFSVLIQVEEGSTGESWATNPTSCIEIAYIALNAENRLLQFFKTERKSTGVVSTFEVSDGSQYVPFVALQTFNGPDPAYAVIKHIKDDSVVVEIREEQSKDDEVAHVDEIVAFVAIQSLNESLNSGNTVGDVVIAILSVLFCITIALYCFRRKKRKQKQKASQRPLPVVNQKESFIAKRVEEIDLSVWKPTPVNSFVVMNMSKPNQLAAELDFLEKIRAMEEKHPVACFLCKGKGKLTASNLHKKEEEKYPDLPSYEEATGKPSQSNDCWVCYGTGKVGNLLTSYEAPNEEEDDGLPCLICYDVSQYGLSTECAHFYCKHCIVRTLESILDTGQFPAYCPQCRADAGGREIELGRIEPRALTYLAQRKVISKKLHYRFLKQANQLKNDNYFECPSKCGNYLIDRDPNYDILKITYKGVCKCGAVVCCACHNVMTNEDHECPPDLAKRAMMDAASQALIGSLCKKCPMCDTPVLKNGGCNIMMCGTHTHGKLADALKNGGCGYQFIWETLAPANTYYYDLDGNKVTGNPVTDRQKNRFK